MSEKLSSLSAIVEALQDGSLTAQGIEELMSAAGVQSTMDATELASLLSYMTTSQLVAAIKSLISNNDENIGGSMIRTVWVLLAISTLVLFARLLVKWRTVRRIFWDDACMISALVGRGLDVSRVWGDGLTAE